MKKSTVVLLTILIILITDQIVKFYIKTHIHYGDGFDILGLSWAKIHFVENEGMAFGMSFGGLTGKYILSIFRIIMVTFLFYILRSLIKQNETTGLIISFSMIIAGALGNIIDSMFYGLIFSESYFHGGLATLFPAEGGYGSFLTGKVVDMLYFPLIDTVLPEWVPVWGGERFEFFRPVFNIADSAITVGVASILLFHRRFFSNETVKENKTAEEVNTQGDTSQA
ncbi:MAG: lipoprotein signal peptidase [Saprospiraceae bacterium]|nr:lipoprotein signal peptidase [Saprospiraceae bacterium]MBK8667977.1 lipoprotein signal peptidase [Saprospiraceae bacterium]